MIRLLVKFGSTVRRVANVDIATTTARLTFHWSAWALTGMDGRVNYHVSPNPGVNFIQCLLDLTEIVPLVAYVIPAVTVLDLAGNMRSGDHVVELDDGSEGALGFEFFVLPFNVPPLPGEIWRLIVEGRYGLACVLVSGALFPMRSCSSNPCPLTIYFNKLTGFADGGSTAECGIELLPIERCFIKGAGTGFCYHFDFDATDSACFRSTFNGC